MFTADVRFEGFTPVDWGRLLSLFRVIPKRPLDANESDEPRGGLVLVHRGDRIRKILHTVDGRIDPSAVSWPRPLHEVAKEQRAAWAWSLRFGALEELMERFGARMRRGDDALTQVLLLLGALRELLEDGSIEVWPRRLKNVPVPTRAVVDRFIDTLVPAGKCGLLALYEDGELWTAVTIRREAKQKNAPARFDVIAGPARLRQEMGLLSGEFRRDYRHLVDAVEAFYAPVSLGLHAEIGTFRALITSADKGAWARAVALRDIVVKPMPLGLTIPLGLDATRGAFEFAGRMARQVDRLGIVQPLLRAFSAAVPKLPSTAATDGTPTKFDPLDVLRKLLNR
ncbi:MAG: hypothetical protein NVS3B20_06790 [Polyangiales bacterium]